MQTNGVNRRRAALIVISIVGIFVVLRAFLWFSPHSNLNVGTFNIHHLFTGLLLVLFAGLPLAVVEGESRFVDLCAIGFGIGLGMGLDEWVYLIATDGSDLAYWSPESVWGGVGMVALAVIYIVGLAYLKRKR